VQGNRQIMTPQRRESGVLSSGRQETAAMGGRDLHAAAAAPAAPPPRRSTHKFIHFYQNTSLYGAWQK
jgi:hypothetical protein